MALQNLTNKCTLSGQIGADILTMDSSPSDVKIYDAITATKTANKTVWTEGILLYTITINNGETIDFETPSFSDTLNTTLVDYVTDSFKVGGAVHAHNYASGVLTATLPTITAGNSLTITFEVVRV